MPSSSLRAVTFDMDGLMFNTEEVYSAVGTKVLQRRGHEFTLPLKKEMMGRPPQASFEVMIDWCSLDDGWEQLRDESEVIYIDLLDDYLAPMPGLWQLLDSLEAAGVPKAIATSSQPTLVEVTLSRFGLQPRFECILTAGDITQGKPHPEIYLKAAERLGVPPEEMMVLEDSQIGCRAAAAAGAFVVAVPSEHSQDHDFSVANLVADSLADPRIFEALGIAIGG